MATRTWTGASAAGTNLWSDSGNWAGGLIATAGDTASVPLGVVDASSVSLVNVSVNISGGNQFTLKSTTLPAGTRRVALRSRAGVPERLQPGSADGRRLGVAIADVRLDGHPLADGDPRFRRGWHAPEAQWRWTDGDAELDVFGASDLAFELACTTRYWADPQTDRGAPLAA